MPKVFHLFNSINRHSFADHLTVSDKASIAIALFSAVSVFIIFAQAVIMYFQTKYSNKLIEIELSRDRQANLVSAWIEVNNWFEPSFPETQEKINHFSGQLQVRLLNKSDLPIYNIKPKYLGYWDSDTEFQFFRRYAFNALQINVLPPARGEIDWFIVSVTDTELRIWPSEKNSDPIITFDPSKYTHDQFKKLGIVFSFRCSDGTEWVRRIDGTLESDDGFLS